MSVTSRVWRVTRPLQDGSLSVLLFLLPFSKAIVSIAFVPLLVGWLLERCNPLTRTHTVWMTPSLRPIAFAIGAYFAICALSIVVSDFPYLSLRGVFLKWFKYLTFVVVIADLGDRSSVISRSVSALGWSSVCVVGYAALQELFTTHGTFQIHPAWNYHRMTGPYENPIDLATYLMVLIPIFLGVAIRQKGQRRVGVCILIGLLTLCVARTEAVGAWLGLGVGLSALASVKSRLRNVARVLLLGGALSGWICLTHPGHARNISSLSDIGTADRLVMWQAAARMIKDRPVLGHGINTFMANYLKYWVGGERQPRYAHNCYLQVAAETGLIGLLAFLWLLGCLFWLWFKALRQVCAEDSVILLGLIGGLLAFAAQSAIDTNFYSLRQAGLFWSLSGLATGLAMTARKRQAVENTGS